MAGMIVKPLQHLVSQKKKRLIKDGFDLDLSYITDNVIAMGLPCTGKTALYRNPQSEVIKFLNHYHSGEYKIYNLCTRPKDQYDPEKFDGRVASFPFEDHGVPRLDTVDALARSVMEWLQPSRSRVVCIHCLAGKGRTGLMVCAALLRMGIQRNALEAMAFYGEQRMKNKKGVTQASQRRWVQYYEQTLKLPNLEYGQRRTLAQVRIRPAPPKVSKKDKSRETPISSTKQEKKAEKARAFSDQQFCVRVYDGETRTIGDSGLFTGSSILPCDMTGDVCFGLLDDEGKLLAQMFLHSAFLDQPILECDIKWWDVERHHKLGKKTMKHIIVDFVFEDDGTFDVPRADGEASSYLGGMTPAPTTDKETRRAQNPTVGDDDDDDDDDDLTEDAIEFLEHETPEGTTDDSSRLDELNALFERRRGGGLLGGLKGMLRGRLGSGSDEDRSHSDSGRREDGCSSPVHSGMPLRPPSERLSTPETRPSEIGPLGTVDDDIRLAELNDMINQRRGGSNSRGGTVLGSMKALFSKGTSGKSSKLVGVEAAAGGPRIDTISARANTTCQVE